MYDNQKIKSVCYNCPNRNIGCHSNCVEYQKEVSNSLKKYKERYNEWEIKYALKDSKERRIKSKINCGKNCHKK